MCTQNTHMSIFVVHPKALSFAFCHLLSFCSICCLFYSYVFTWLLIRARVASFSSLSLLSLYACIYTCKCVFHSRLFCKHSFNYRWLVFHGIYNIYTTKARAKHAHCLNGKRKKQYSNYTDPCELWSVDFGWNMQIFFLCHAKWYMHSSISHAFHEVVQLLTVPLSSSARIQFAHLFRTHSTPLHSIPFHSLPVIRLSVSLLLFFFSINIGMLQHHRFRFATKNYRTSPEYQHT